tara:strand:+ start:3354 stop:4037 length:684 start_codon:yes stop_codon:yes gene_type:complete
MEGTFRSSDYSHIVLDQRGVLSNSEKEMQTLFFNFWRQYWNDILDRLHISSRVDDNDFFDQQKITVIVYKNEIVTMHLLGIANTNLQSGQRYFSRFTPQFGDFFKKNNVNRILALQYLAFSPTWQKRKETPFIYMPAVMASLSVLQQKIENVDAVVSVGRKDLGVSNSLAKMNFASCIPDGNYNNTPVSYQVSFDAKIYPKKEVKQITDDLWGSKVEIGGKNIQEVA